MFSPYLHYLHLERSLPHDFPPWSTVSGYFYRWQRLGVWEKMNAVLRKQVRVAAGRHAEPTAGIIDSQSVKTTEKGGSVVMMQAKRSKVATLGWVKMERLPAHFVMRLED